MLKKLFSRKKPVVVTKPEKKPVEATPVLSLPEWVTRIDEAQGKSQASLMTQLIEQIQKKQFSAEEVVNEMSGLAKSMLAIQLDQNHDFIPSNQWREITLTGFTAKIRKTAAENIQEEGDLVSLVKEVRGKDKTVYRIVHDKLEQLHAQQKQHQDWVDKKTAVLDAMQRLAEAPLEPMYEAKLKGFVEQWSTLAVDDQADVAAFSKAQKAAGQKLLVVAEQEKAKLEKETSVKMADSNRQGLIDTLTHHLLERIESLDLGEDATLEDQHLITDIQHQWREIDQHAKANKEELRAFQRASTALEVGLPRLKSILEKYGDIDNIVSQLADSEQEQEVLLHDIDDWLHDVEFVLAIRVPDSVLKLKQALERFQKSLADHRQQEIDKIRVIRSQLRRCLSAVEEGSLRRASGLYHGIEDKLEGFDLTHHAGIRKQLEETTEALEKLRDWQSFAVLPKKEALIKRMSNLVEQSVDPESRANAIREMQDEWKLLSRGLQNRQQDMWETFHELAQKAYEPCKEFFSEQRNLREVNLDRRKEVVEQLNTYDAIVDWSQPDVKEIDQVLQVARNDWRRYSPVDRVANKPVQKKFDQIHQALFDKLRKEQDIYKQNKLTIIEQAKALLELEDLKDATEQAKKLQRDWKSAGNVARKDEQELWKSFRKVCDELFDRKEQQVTAFKAELETHKDKAGQLIQSIDALTKSSSILAEQSVFESLKAEYDQIGTLPKAHYQKLTKQYNEACQAFERARKTAKLNEADQDWQNLIEWVKTIRYSDVTAETAQDQWAQMNVPTAANSINTTTISGWLKDADELNHAAMHEKTIDLEILTGSESPLVDSGIRMNLQVQRLSEGIGATAQNSDVDAMVVEWLSIGAVEKDFYVQLETRMKAARANWMK
jgi:hypothetical protein